MGLLWGTVQLLPFPKSWKKHQGRIVTIIKDVLVVMPDGVHRRRTAQTIYRQLFGLGFAKDIVVATESDILDYGDNPSLVLFPALREGKELYRAPE